VAFVWSWGRVPRRGAAAAGWIGLAGLGAAAVVWNFTSTVPFYGGSTLFALAVAMVIVAILDGRWAASRVLSVRPLRVIGKVSYGLYLWHLPIFEAVHREFPHRSGSRQAALGLFLTAVATAGSWFIIERPFLRLKDRPWASSGAVLETPSAR
jgi:peptidoglycan/LPS O-acetylase OafA/YrhL